MSGGGGKRGRGTCDGVLCSHFAEEDESDVDDEASDGIADKHAGGTTLRERLASAEEETSPDGASDGNHLDLSRGQFAMETCVFSHG